MSGRGKGGKGLGKGGAKRHRKVLRDNIQGITKPAIRRLARRGGVKRISGLIYEEVRGVLKVFLEHVIRDAVTYTDHSRRKTVTAMDVVYALKRQGRTLYGFGGGGGETFGGGGAPPAKKKKKQPVAPPPPPRSPVRPPVPPPPPRSPVPDSSNSGDEDDETEKKERLQGVIVRHGDGEDTDDEDEEESPNDSVNTLCRSLISDIENSEPEKVGAVRIHEYKASETESIDELLEEMKENDKDMDICGFNEDGEGTKSKSKSLQYLESALGSYPGDDDDDEDTMVEHFWTQLGAFMKDRRHQTYVIKKSKDNEGTIAQTVLAFAIVSVTDYDNKFSLLRLRKKSDVSDEDEDDEEISEMGTVVQLHSLCARTLSNTRVHNVGMRLARVAAADAFERYCALKGEDEAPDTFRFSAGITRMEIKTKDAKDDKGRYMSLTDDTDRTKALPRDESLKLKLVKKYEDEFGMKIIATLWTRIAPLVKDNGEIVQRTKNDILFRERIRKAKMDELGYLALIHKSDAEGGKKYIMDSAWYKGDVVTTLEEFGLSKDDVSIEAIPAGLFKPKTANDKAMCNKYDPFHGEMWLTTKQMRLDEFANADDSDEE